jgi:hypothetical protein
MSVHKAIPSHVREGFCVACGQRIHRVPGGHGATWVHSDTGAVAGMLPAEASILWADDGADDGSGDPPIPEPLRGSWGPAT